MDWSEEGFIQHIAKLFPVENALVGIGDDCAVIPNEKGLSWLVTTDALVEGIHFLKDQISPRQLGYKTIAVNVSDISAMGGEPKYAFLSVAFPNSEGMSSWAQEFVQGIKEACQKWHLLLLGGDTVGSKRDLFLNVTMIGLAKSETIKYRHQAQDEDIICVTGYLGDSGGGFKALQDKLTETQEIKLLVNAHFHPEPNPQQGIWLASQNGVHAMMDLSDGLDCDLRRLIKSSQKGAVVELNQIPISEALAKTGQKNGWDTLQLALGGGEDYCLLLTVAKDAFKQVQQEFQKTFNQPLFPIGKVAQSPKDLIYHQNGKEIQKHYSSFNHFQKEYAK